ncbi:MAG: hypothetical protein QF704_09475, partial [Anaerolineales bacterium]|nr:hypothetical protein [Anaerolineales bacterium]
GYFPDLHLGDCSHTTTTISHTNNRPFPLSGAHRTGRLFPGGSAKATVWIGDEEIMVEELIRRVLDDTDWLEILLQDIQREQHGDQDQP